MITIYKYNVVSQSAKIKLPINAKILDIQCQGSEICLWAEIDTDQDEEEVIIQCFGSGHALYQDMGVDREYIATVQHDGYVWHFYKYTGV